MSLIKRRRAFAWTSLVAGVAIVALYLKTLCPTTSWQDAGIFLRSVFLLGNCYPTGYPSYICSSYFATCLPNAALGLNAFSALAAGVAAAATVAVTWLWSPTEETAPIAAAVAVGVFFTAPAVWAQGTVAEVYTLNAAFAAAVVFSLISWQRSGDARWLWLAAFLYGVAAGVHPLQATFLPSYLLYAAAGGRGRSWSPALIAGAMAAFCLGASVYLFLPLRSAAGATPDWGATATLPRFGEHVLGLRFRAAARFHWPLLGARGAVAAATLPAQIGWFAAVGGGLGLLLAARRRFMDTMLITGAGVTAVAFILCYYSANWRTYLTPGYYALALGAAYLTSGAVGICRRRSLVILGAVLLGVGAWGGAAFRFALADKSRDRGAGDAAAKVLETIDYRGALLLSHSGGAVIGPIAGVVTAFRSRPDIVIWDASGDRQFEDFAEFAGAPSATRVELLPAGAYERALITLARDRTRPLFLLAPEPALGRFGFRVAKRHLLYRVVHDERSPERRDWWSFYWRRGEPGDDVTDYWNGTFYAAVYLAEAQDRDAAGDVVRAEGCRRRARRFAVGSAEAEALIGYDAARRGAWAEAEAALRRAVKLDPSFATARYQLIGVLTVQGKDGEAARARADFSRILGREPEGVGP